MPSTVPVFPLTSSMQSGLRFCGIKLLPVEKASESFTKLNSWVLYIMRSSARRLRCTEVRDDQNRYSAGRGKKKSAGRRRKKRRNGGNSLGMINKIITNEIPIRNSLHTIIASPTRKFKFIGKFNTIDMKRIASESSASQWHHIHSFAYLYEPLVIALQIPGVTITTLLLRICKQRKPGKVRPVVSKLGMWRIMNSPDIRSETGYWGQIMAIFYLSFTSNFFKK